MWPSWVIGLSLDPKGLSAPAFYNPECNRESGHPKEEGGERCVRVCYSGRFCLAKITVTVERFSDYYVTISSEHKSLHLLLDSEFILWISSRCFARSQWHTKSRSCCLWLMWPHAVPAGIWFGLFLKEEMRRLAMNFNSRSQFRNVQEASRLDLSFPQCWQKVKCASLLWIYLSRTREEPLLDRSGQQDSRNRTDLQPQSKSSNVLPSLCLFQCVSVTELFSEKHTGCSL